MPGSRPKALIITEKPSVAKDIVAALGGFTARAGGDYWESEDYLCSFAVGHLFTLFEPEDIDSRFKQWKLSLLPIIPARFQLKPLASHDKRIKVLAGLVGRKDVNCLINACDAAREGELIFREIVQFMEARQWVRRLWLQSMTPEAIRHGFSVLRDGTDLSGLGAAAECRARTDWLIGMNATRAFSERLRLRDERTPWSVGRVQTPTLALLVARELEILSHRRQAFARLVAKFAASTSVPHEYEGTWFDPKFKANEEKPELKDDRIFGRDQVEAVLQSLQGAPAVASETRDESQRQAPYLFNLTGLQKYMAQRYKWSSKRTLEAAQRCYEGHKVLTYPRTSSQCLPEDYRPEVERLVRGFAEHPDYSEAAAYLLQHGRANDKRTFNNAGVSDHFAIIPTGKAKPLAGDDAKLYDAVVRRFLATFHPPAVYDRVKRTTVVAGQHFRTGPVETLVVPGWLAVYDKSPEAASKTLPPLVAGKKTASGVGVKLQGTTVKEEVTKPPPRINEAGLLSLMEHAGRQIENEELQAALNSAEGLGTAATRADIIQNLKAKEYTDEALRPTCKGIHLIRTLDRLKVARLTSAELTAQLELELAEVEAGKRREATFMAEIGRYTTEVVEAARRLDWERLYPDTEPLGLCPVCAAAGGESKPQVFERRLFYACASVRGRGEGCGLILWKNISSRYLDRGTVDLLLSQGHTHELDGFKTKAGLDFRAALELRDTKVRLLEGGVATEAEVPETGGGSRPSGVPGGARGSGVSADRASLGPCPIHGKDCQVVATRGAFVCATRLQAFSAGEERPEGLMLPRLLCKRELTQDEVSGMLRTGVSAELQGFVSKTGKPFSAKLRLTPEGGFTFEFPDRQKDTREPKRPPFRPKRRPGARSSAL